jgi:hypothetical protein
MINHTSACSFKDKGDDYRMFIQYCLVARTVAQLLTQACAEQEEFALSDMQFREIVLHRAELV